MGSAQPDSSKAEATTIPKTPTGIGGLDDLTLGGLPTGRPTLLCGAAGCGKTLFAMTFLVNGASAFGEPGVFMSFEESGPGSSANVASLGYRRRELIADKKLVIDHVRIERAEIEESGEYDLEGLFVRLGYAIDTIGAKRVVLDTDRGAVLGLGRHRHPARRASPPVRLAQGQGRHRHHHRRTRRGPAHPLRHRGVRFRLRDPARQPRPRPGLTRRLRVVKYRGSAHGTNEYPFLIDDDGISVLPITSAGLRSRDLGRGGPDRRDRSRRDARASAAISGVERADLRAWPAPANRPSARPSPTPPASAANAASISPSRNRPSRSCATCARSGSTCRSMSKPGCCAFEAARPSLFGFEMHLARMNRDIEQFKPAASSSIRSRPSAGRRSEIHATLLRLADICKTRGITAVFTSLSAVDEHDERERPQRVVADGHLDLAARHRSGRRAQPRAVSAEVARHEPFQPDPGISCSPMTASRLIEPYIGPEGVLTGAARLAQEAREREAEHERREQATERRRREMARKRGAARAADRRDARGARGGGGRGREAARAARGARSASVASIAPPWRQQARSEADDGYEHRALMTDESADITICGSTSRARRRNRWRRSPT